MSGMADNETPAEPPASGEPPAAGGHWVERPEIDARKNQRWDRKEDRDLELAARWNEVEFDHVDLAQLTDKQWVDYREHRRVQNMGNYYQIYRHVFGAKRKNDNWRPKKNLVVDFGDSTTDRVFRGNFMEPSQTLQVPKVAFTVDEGAMFTLMMVSPDGYTTGDTDSVFAHWIVTNITDSSNLAEATTVADYTPAMPLQGTGYHRYAFVLFRHTSELEWDTASDTKDRLVNVRELMKSDRISPQGMCMFQAKWDSSVDATFESAFGHPAPTF